MTTNFQEYLAYFLGENPTAEKINSLDGCTMESIRKSVESYHASRRQYNITYPPLDMLYVHPDTKKKMQLWNGPPGPRLIPDPQSEGSFKMLMPGHPDYPKLTEVDSFTIEGQLVRIHEAYELPLNAFALVSSKGHAAKISGSYLLVRFQV